MEFGTGVAAYYNQEPLALGGWSYGVPRLQSYEQQITVPGPGGGPNTPDGSSVCGVTLNYSFIDMSGSAHPLSLSHIYDNAAGFFGNTNYECGNSEFHESDISALDPIYSAALVNIQPDTAHENGLPAPPNDGTAEVAGPDGTLYTFSSVACAYSSLPCVRYPSIEDKNGNIASVILTDNGVTNPPGFLVTDTAGRAVLTGSAFGKNGSTVTVSGLPSSYALTWAKQSYSGYTVNKQDHSPAQSPQICPGSGTYSTGAGQESVVTKLTLPNGQAYTFSYDPAYGTLSKVTYPSGGYIRYVYGLNSLSAGLQSNGEQHGNFFAGACFVYLDTAAVTKRFVSFDGVNEQLEQDYAYSTSWGNGNVAWVSKQTTVTTNDNVRATTYKTTYNYTDELISPPINGGYYGSAGLEQSVIYGDTTGKTLKTVTKGWQDQYSVACEIDTDGSSGQANGKFYTYGAGDAITDEKDYDYGLTTASSCTKSATAPSGVTPTREMTTTYQVFPATLFSSPSILDAPCRVVVKDGSGNAVSETDTYFDNGTTVCGAIGKPSVTTAGSLPAGTHDETNFGVSGTIARGDATRVDRVVSSGKVATTTFTYDETGQPTSQTDPCGNATCADMPGSTGHTTTFSFADSPADSATGNTNAYLTSVTPPTVNGVSHTTAYTYNYASGAMQTSVDANGQTITYTYNSPPSDCSTTDGLNRLSQVAYPDQGVTTYCYNDSVPSVTTKRQISPGVWAVNVTTMDQLGHVLHTQMISDPAGGDTVSNSYDGDGRVYKKTNPQRTSASLTDGTQTFYYDALGRPIKVLEQDGTSTLQWCYGGQASLPAVANCSTTRLGSVTSGTWVDLTDETGNHTQKAYDSFGRLTEVMEPNGTSTSPTMETDYSYDVLNDLKAVTQWGGPKGSSGARTRSFTYDNLARLLTSSNPEAGAICYGQGSGSNCTNGYDANGNLLYKTDARGITISYLYDALNRLVQKGSPLVPTASTPKYSYSCYQYDRTSVSGASGTGNFVGRLSNSWTQISTSPPTSLVCPSSPSSTALSLRSVMAYDSMGRVQNEQQCTQANCTKGTPFSPSYTYDLAGNVVSYTNGVNNVPVVGSITFGQQYDGAGRLQGLSSSWNPVSGSSGVPFPLFTADPASGYTPTGAIQNIILGNNIFVNRTYDNRMRITGQTATHP